MKKTAPFLSFLLFYAITMQAQIPQYEYVPDVKGNVKVLNRTGSLTYVQDGKLVTSINENDYLFDRNGKVLEIHTTGSFNGMKDSIPGSEYVTVYIYNEKGLPVTEISTNVGESKPYKVIKPTYDDNGHEVTQLHKSFYSSESTNMLYRAVYNKKGQRTEQISLASQNDGSFKEREKWKYKYDKNNREIERQYYDYDTKQYWKDQSTVYDLTSGKILERYSYHADGSIYTKTLYSYDDEGKLSSTTSFQNGEPRGTTQYTYTDKDTAGNYCLRLVAPAIGLGYSSKIKDVITYY